MISIVHIVGLCRFHFSAQVEIENVVFEINWNEFVLSMLVHQILKMSASFTLWISSDFTPRFRYKLRASFSTSFLGFFRELSTMPFAT